VHVRLRAGPPLRGDNSDHRPGPRYCWVTGLGSHRPYVGS
jgi:hypothetical protein